MGFESRHVPDHSLLKCSIMLVGQNEQSPCKNSVPNVSYTKFDCGTIPLGFCEDESFLLSLNAKIQEISSSNSVQEEVNLLYNEFCGALKMKCFRNCHIHIKL